MAKVEIEVSDDGTIDFSALPEAVAAPFQSEFNKAFQKGSFKKSEELRPHLANKEEHDELERLRQETHDREVADSEKQRQYEEAKAKTAEQHQAELAARQTEITKRDTRIQHGLRAEIRAAALAAEAREESLEELALILAPRLGLDGDFNTIVKNADGEPATDKDGKALSIDSFVTDYLESHQHHRRPQGGKGGGATGGASTQGVATGHTERDAAVQAVKERPNAQSVGKLLKVAGKRTP